MALLSHGREGVDIGKAIEEWYRLVAQERVAEFDSGESLVAKIVELERIFMPHLQAIS